MKTLHLYYLKCQVWLRRIRSRQLIHERIARLTGKPSVAPQSETPEISATVKELLFLEYVKTAVLVLLYISLWLMFLMVHQPAERHVQSPPIQSVPFPFFQPQSST